MLYFWILYGFVFLACFIIFLSVTRESIIIINTKGKISFIVAEFLLCAFWVVVLLYVLAVTIIKDIRGIKPVKDLDK